MGYFINLLNTAIRKVSVVRYALGIVGMCSAIAIIKSFGIDNYKVPAITLLIFFAFTVLLFLFSIVTTSKDKALRVAGYLLVYAVVLIALFVSGMLVTSTFFDFPKPVEKFLMLSSTPKLQVREVSSVPVTSSFQLICAGRIINQFGAFISDAQIVIDSNVFYSDSYGNFNFLVSSDINEKVVKVVIRTTKFGECSKYVTLPNNQIVFHIDK